MKSSKPDKYWSFYRFHHFIPWKAPDIYVFMSTYSFVHFGRLQWEDVLKFLNCLVVRFLRKEWAKTKFQRFETYNSKSDQIELYYLVKLLFTMVICTLRIPTLQLPSDKTSKKYCYSNSFTIVISFILGPIIFASGGAPTVPLKKYTGLHLALLKQF